MSMNVFNAGSPEDLILGTIVKFGERPIGAVY